MYEYLNQHSNEELNLLRIHIDNDRFAIRYNTEGLSPTAQHGCPEDVDYDNTQYVYECIMDILYKRKYINHRTYTTFKGVF